MIIIDNKKSRHLSNDATFSKGWAIIINYLPYTFDSSAFPTN